MIEQLKHECGIALVRLRKPLEYYREKYGSETYALDRLYLLMEKQHNRGQEAAGVGVVDLNAEPGHEYIFRQRELGTGAIDSIFANIGKEITAARVKGVKSLPFVGQIYMGHLRYSTTGRAGMEYTHPFLRRNNWRSRTLMLCGNFNMTNADDIFAASFMLRTPVSVFARNGVSSATLSTPYRQTSCIYSRSSHSADCRISAEPQNWKSPSNWRSVSP